MSKSRSGTLTQFLNFQNSTIYCPRCCLPVTTAITFWFRSFAQLLYYFFSVKLSASDVEACRHLGVDILEKKMADLPQLVESLEEAGYMVQAGRIRNTMTQSVMKQKAGGHGSTGQLNTSSSSKICVENVEPDRTDTHEVYPTI